MTDRELELLAENRQLRAELDVTTRQLAKLDPELVRLRAENAELIRALGLNEAVMGA